MSRNVKLGIGLFLIAAATALVSFFVATNDIAVLSPKGVIGEQQRDLMLIATGLGMIVIIPVFVMTFMIAWKYRASNTKAKYNPDWDHNRVVETIWWGIPIVIILVLSVITWRSSHALDPYRALDSDVRPLKVQVIALQWKWLFLYPEYGVASVNSLYVPVDTPLNFELTSDAPMNSFWIPKLGGQVYAMSGMSTKLHLIANETGTYPGSSANISGEGFAGMRFMTHAVSHAQFDEWVRETTRQADPLTDGVYDVLSMPSKDVEPRYYRLEAQGLYDKVIMKYMMPAGTLHHRTEQTHETGHNGH